MSTTMKILRGNIFSTIIILVLVSYVASYECPEDCTCGLKESIDRSLNHAKCSSLNGFKGEERGLPIHSLDLSNASLIRISHILEKLKDLTNLDLSYNSLSDIGRLGRRIKILNLSHNKITSGKLMKIPNHVEKLDLSHNEITYLPLELTKLKNLRSIDLAGNTINCTCETLEVRNWLQRHHVWSDNTVKCTYPVDAKGKSWLRVKQSEICENEGVTQRYSRHTENDYENDLMLSDQPIINEGSGDAEVFDELGKTFLVVSERSNVKFDRLVEGDFGSGDGMDAFETHIGENPKLVNSSEVNTETPELIEDDYSGSGMGLFVIPYSLPISPHSGNLSDLLLDETNNTLGEDEEDSSPIASPMDEITPAGNDIFGQGLGIIELDSSNSTTEEVGKEEPQEISEEIIVPVNVPETEAEIPPSSNASADVSVPDTIDSASDSQKENISIEDNTEASTKEASTGENMSTYILLGIVIAIVVILIAFVAIKRIRSGRRNRRQGDAESPRGTELLDMDKKNLGKPIHKNGGTERAPLIKDRSKADVAKPVNGNKKVPYVPHEGKDVNAQEPLLNNREEPRNVPRKTLGEQQESNNNITPLKQNEPTAQKSSESKTDIPDSAIKSTTPRSQDKPEVTPRKGTYPPPRSPKPPKSPTTGDDDVFLPSSPKTSRYSPVYSPETGKVKIKLTETPKPKTPILVTRSSINTGEMITKPEDNAQYQTVPTGK